MIKYIIQNIKQDILSIYFIISILLVCSVCLLSPGIGALDYNYINKPMVIEELLQHSKAEYLSFSEMYNYYGIFQVGISGFLYMIFPLLSMSSLHRYCEERTSGFWTQKIVKTGQHKGTVCNLISSSIVSILSVLAGLTMFILFLIIRLPSQKFEVLLFMPRLFSICTVVVLSTMISMLIASLTKNKFYSFIIPVLLIYAENEFTIGLGGVFSSFSIQVMMNPRNMFLSFGFIAAIILALYKVIDKVERGQCGIGI